VLLHLNHILSIKPKAGYGLIDITIVLVILSPDNRATASYESNQQQERVMLSFQSSGLWVRAKKESEVTHLRDKNSLFSSDKPLQGG
jgi:hypothetical protein